jgi:hypothetical protein
MPYFYFNSLTTNSCSCPLLRKTGSESDAVQQQVQWAVNFSSMLFYDQAIMVRIMTQPTTRNVPSGVSSRSQSWLTKWGIALLSGRLQLKRIIDFIFAEKSLPTIYCFRVLHHALIFVHLLLLTCQTVSVAARRASRYFVEVTRRGLAKPACILRRVNESKIIRFGMRCFKYIMTSTALFHGYKLSIRRALQLSRIEEYVFSIIWDW